MRNFNSSALHHIYQRAKDHGVIFYTDYDRLVFYSITACEAKKYGIKVSAASIMFTHFHYSVFARTNIALLKFVNYSLASFSRAYNYHYRRSGQLFARHFGHGQNHKDKQKRTNLAYVFNNHVEKGLCSSPLEERWCFLAYARNNNPFSEPVVKKEVSPEFKRFSRLVIRRYNKLSPLCYSELEKMHSLLNETEWQQLIDHIIVTYSLVDYESAVKHFKNFDEMIYSFSVTTGNGFDINEEYNPDSDTPYLSMINISQKRGWVGDTPIIYNMGIEQISAVAKTFYSIPGVSLYQIKKFLHF